MFSQKIELLKVTLNSKWRNMLDNLKDEHEKEMSKIQSDFDKYWFELSIQKGVKWISIDEGKTFLKISVEAGFKPEKNEVITYINTKYKS